jgi:hypothetical protein
METKTTLNPETTTERRLTIMVLADHSCTRGGDRRKWRAVDTVTVSS